VKHAFASVAALLLSVSLLLTGQGLQGTLLPVRATLEHFSTISVGTFGAAYFLGFTLGCLKGGELVRRVGHVRVFLAMAAIASAAPLVHGLVIEPWIWSMLRLLTGFCFAILYVVIESWLNERSTNETRGVIFSTYAMITLTVLAAGQMMMVLYDPSGLQLFAIASVLVSVAAVPVGLSTSPSPEPPQSVTIDVPRLFRISPAGTLGCLATGLANGSFWSLAPLFTAGLSDNLSLAAWFMTSVVIGGALAQWPMGLLSDHIDRRAIMGGMTLAAATLGALIVYLADGLSHTQLNLLGACWGAAALPMYAISVAHANDHAGPNEYVTVSSGLLLVYGIGAIVGPFTASLLMTATGATGLYMFTTLIHVMLAAVIVVRAIRSRAPASEQRITFSDALATAHTASQIYEEEIQQQQEEEG
jgi:MFS family permease